MRRSLSIINVDRPRIPVAAGQGDAMNSRVLSAALVLVSLLAPVGRARAQNGDAVLRGSVVDPMQAAIPNAEVTVTGGGAPLVVRTDANGGFSVTVGEGTYAVTVIAPGFTAERITVTVRAGQTAEPRMALAVAGVREDVTVTAPGGYRAPVVGSATRTATPLRDLPQSVTVVTDALIKDQLMTSVADVMRYVPGVTTHQGENNRDQIITRGNSSSADFFVNGVRDDVQYYRDLYNLDRVEALKGPNALTFGRGGAGGVVNRVVKEASPSPLREVILQGGQSSNRRMTADLNQPLSSRVAVRLNGMIEDSGSFRNNVTTERAAINPTVTVYPSDGTRVTASYEYLRDRRVADRGITSYQGSPAEVPGETFYGDPSQSHVRGDVQLATAGLEHRFGRTVLRSRLQVADYGRFYQNFVPGAAAADRSSVALTAYNNATDRANVFNQTDLTLTGATGRLEHRLLTGVEAGRQITDNFRETGFFNNTTAAVQVPFDTPQVSIPVIFRQNGTDADNHVRTTLAAAFVQDQVRVSRFFQLIGG